MEASNQHRQPAARDLFLGRMLAVADLGIGVFVAEVGKDTVQSTTMFAERMLVRFGPKAMPSALLLCQALPEYNHPDDRDPARLFKMLRDTDFHPTQIAVDAVLLNSILHRKGITGAEYSELTNLFSAQTPGCRLQGALVGAGLQKPGLVGLYEKWIREELASPNSANPIHIHFAISALAAMRSINPIKLNPEAKECLKKLRAEPALGEFQGVIDGAIATEGLSVKSPSGLLRHYHKRGNLKIGGDFVIQKPFPSEVLPPLAKDTASLMLEFFGMPALPAAVELVDLWPSDPSPNEGLDEILMAADDILPEQRILASAMSRGPVAPGVCAAMIRHGTIVDCFVALNLLERRKEIILPAIVDVINTPAVPLERRCFAAIAAGWEMDTDTTIRIIRSLSGPKGIDQDAITSAIYVGRFGSPATELFATWYQNRRLPWQDFLDTVRNR
jgi:hypothetical protein